MMMFKYISLLCFFLFSQMAFAIQVSDLFVVANSKDKAVVTVTNTERERVFLNSSVSEIIVTNNGKTEEIKYTKDNIEAWKLNVYPARSILEPGFKKDVTMKFSCITRQCNRNQDHVFKVGLVPVPYYEGEPDSSLVQFSIGFAPIIVVPANPSKIDLEYSYTQQGKLTLINRGKTFLYVDVFPEGCAGGDTKCVKHLKILSGRKYETMFPELASQVLSIKSRTYRGVFKKEGSIQPGAKGRL
ncbi:hypothetical protein L1D52_04170 [Vibrio brasiliensis]|uniref:hypothetical protein n=1 Tax=Vibrio brasiliensis TaxID=170652 RepID=UPI001EFC2FDF|nr:hypothetical protein [Vibrio brasiliensis]MCG9781537.1 hypothetical protein [Vibrio brasiliensis]